jgi:RNA polymerase sigma factor (sigma-70 family)
MITIAENDIASLYEYWAPRLSVSAARYLLHRYDHEVPDVVQTVFSRLQPGKTFDNQKHMECWLFLVCRNAAFKLRSAQKKLVVLGLPSQVIEFDSQDIPEKFKDTLRKNNTKELIEKFKHGEELDSQSPLQQLEQKEQREKLWLAISSLKPVYRELLRMFYYEELSYKEIGEKLGITSGLVGFKLNYARQKVRKTLEEQNG